MKAQEIYDKILMQSDEVMLNNLPTQQRLACKKCNTVSLTKRASGNLFCPTCKAETEVVSVTYYYKNKTVNPDIAIERHRSFWNRIYFEQLSKENYIKP